jgi:hypothetical protein
MEADLQDKLDDANDKLARVQQWLDAYPEEQFPDQDLKKAREALEAAGVSMGAMHAMWARHILKNVREILSN